MREVITCHLGQAGCSVGQKVWELFCVEHGIEPDGTMPSDESVGSMEDPFNTFFHETPSGQHVPRTLFMDTDPSTKHEILGPRSKWRDLYNPEQVMGYKQDCRSNFFEGRTQAIEYHIVDEMMDRLRKEADKCSNLAGFFTFRSFGGGTGSGIGCELLEALREQFEKKVILEPVLYPSAEYSSSAVEPYNCLFATAYSKAVCDLSLMLDNQAAYKLCRDRLAVKNPTFYHLNRLISQVVSACTTSLRFESMINASLLEIVHNIVEASVDAMQAINGLCHPKASYRAALRFLPWIESGFKVGVVGVPPTIPSGGDGKPFMAPSDRQGCLLANTTAVRTMFLRQYKKFLQLFYHKSYVWQFVDANGEMDMFYEAKEIVRTIIDDHEALLQQCMEKESETNVLEMVGATTHPHDANAAAEDNPTPLVDEENDQRIAQQVIVRVVFYGGSSDDDLVARYRRYTVLMSSASRSRSRSYSKSSDRAERSRSKTPTREEEDKAAERSASEHQEDRAVEHSASEHQEPAPEEKSPVKEREESEGRRSGSEDSVRSSRRGDSGDRREERSRSRSPYSRRRGSSRNERSRSRSEQGGSRGRSESDSRRPAGRRERSRSRTPGGRGGAREGSCSLLVRNLPDDLNPMRLRDAFERFGYVRDVYIPLDYYSKRPRGFGFVEFDDPRDADEARDSMDGQRLGSNYVGVTCYVIGPFEPTKADSLGRIAGMGWDAGPCNRADQVEAGCRSTRKSIASVELGWCVALMVDQGPISYMAIPKSVMASGYIRRMFRAGTNESRELIKQIEWTKYLCGVRGVVVNLRYLHGIF
ncbi:hypothetical protein FOZ60_000810 [Perkinsus olseni]|uniref:RRM domain-containing protein n=1 Tax=Perkinsus olseni TaxID=32597 RepID=A0A7J6PJR9_PEROL|nr:hypothetical protein FOZ60_000810 [Perkinsus olseni]